MSRTSADDLVDALKDHHVRIQQMVDAISSASGHDRVIVFRRLRRFLAAHEAAEEVFVHARATRLLDNSEVADQRLNEEQEAARTIAELEKVEIDSGAFDQIFVELRSSVSKHARAEELRELPEMIERSSATDIERMRQALEHVDLVVSRRHGPLGEDDQSFDAMMSAARAELLALRGDLDA